VVLPVALIFQGLRGICRDRAVAPSVSPDSVDPDFLRNAGDAQHETDDDVRASQPLGIVAAAGSEVRLRKRAKQSHTSHRVNDIHGVGAPREAARPYGLAAGLIEEQDGERCVDLALRSACPGEPVPRHHLGWERGEPTPGASVRAHHAQFDGAASELAARV
jgi:hypothetical protein